MMTASNKEQIRDRMVRTAARLWNVPEVEISSNFDPLVLLMMEACAAEIEQVGYDIAATRSRLLDKLAEVVLPETLLGPAPAHCILQALPSEPVGVVDDFAPFVLDQRSLEQEGAETEPPAEELFFSPIGSFQLVQAELAFCYAGNKLFRLGPGIKRTLIAEAGKQMESNEVWLGISVNKQVTSLRGLQFFFEPGTVHNATLYQSLRNARMFMNGAPVALEGGYFNSSQFEVDLHEIMNKGADVLKQYKRKVAALYQRGFAHLAGDCKPDVSELPAAWQELFSAQVLEQLAASRVCLIQLKFDRNFPVAMLEGLQVQVNAFPACNIMRRTLTSRADNWVNMIPFPADALLYSIHSLKGAQGGAYRFRPSAAIAEIGAGEAIISSSVGSADSYEVREMAGVLINAIRDRSAFFKSIGNDYIISRLKEIEQIMASLEDQLAGTVDVQQRKQYLLFRPKEADDMVTVQFWVTNGKAGNKVKGGASFNPVGHAVVQSKSVIALSGAGGGDDAVSEHGKKRLLQQQVLSGGKVVTANDVKLLCAQIFGAALRSVTVKKGIDIGLGTESGYYRCIDICLRRNQQKSDPDDSWFQLLCQELEYALSERSLPGYPFRIVVEN